jgi:enediyne biosynthesis protein E3
MTIVNLPWEKSAEQAREQMRANIKQRKARILDPRIPERFGQVAKGMWQGYHMALEAASPEQISKRLTTVESELLGFALEGVGMGFTELDLQESRDSSHLDTFLDYARQSAGAPRVSTLEIIEHPIHPIPAYQTMVYLGVGLMLVRLGCDISLQHPALPPEQYYPIVDGYGFNHGIFYWQEFVDKQTRPALLTDDAERVFDQGLGRSLWLINGANPALIAKTIEAFDPSRHQDLWGGVGYACASIGGGDRTILEALGTVANQHLHCLFNSANCAAHYRKQLGNASGYTTLATEVFSQILMKQQQNVPEETPITWRHYRTQLINK